MFEFYGEKFRLKLPDFLYFIVKTKIRGLIFCFTCFNYRVKTRGLILLLMMLIF